MSGLTEIVSENIAGIESKIVTLRGKFYRVKAPTPYVIGRMLKPLGKLDADESENRFDLIQKGAEQYRYMDAAIALAILGDAPLTAWNRFRLWRMKRRFRRANDAERLEAFREILSVITPDAFFFYARLGMELTGRMANTKPLADGH
ncbi:MAG: hypothetical protein LBP50_03250 [Tannerella sp.]|jgi:hypothetical protein|nr:hypothetical protein [Tannerella sp.]